MTMSSMNDHIRFQGMKIVLTRYAAMVLLVFFAFYGRQFDFIRDACSSCGFANDDVQNSGMLTFFSAACMLYIAGLYYREKGGTNGFTNPWLPFGMLFFTGALGWFGVWDEMPNYGDPVSLLLLSAPLALGLFIACRSGVLVASVLVAPMPWLLVILPRISTWGIASVASLFLTLAVVAAFWQGLKNRSGFMITAGMLQIVLFALLLVYL